MFGKKEDEMLWIERANNRYQDFNINLLPYEIAFGADNAPLIKKTMFISGLDLFMEMLKHFPDLESE